MVLNSGVAQVPQIINYRGRGAVGTVNFDGAGQFRFALVNTTGTTTFWSNDGFSVGSERTGGLPYGSRGGAWLRGRPVGHARE